MRELVIDSRLVLVLDGRLKVLRKSAASVRRSCSTILLVSGHRLELALLQRAARCRSLLASIGVACVALLAIHFIDDPHVGSNLALHAHVCFALHLTMRFELLAALFDVLDGSSNSFKLMILMDALLHKRLLVVDSLLLSLAPGLLSCLVQPIVKRQLLLVDDLLPIANHFILITEVDLARVTIWPKQIK